jgi:hypothetical protein
LVLLGITPEATTDQELRSGLCRTHIIVTEHSVALLTDVAEGDCAEDDVVLGVGLGALEVVVAWLIGKVARQLGHLHRLEAEVEVRVEAHVCTVLGRWICFHRLGLRYGGARLVVL